MRRVLWYFAGLSLLSTVGCAMCASPHDCKYGAYGGVRERTDHVHGRVGSVFDPAPEINRAVPAEQREQAIPETPLTSPPAEEIPRDEETPSIVPDELESSPSDNPPMELPEGPEETPNGTELPDAPEGDRIELPDDVTLDDHQPILQPAVTGVIPVTAEEPIIEPPAGP